MIARIWHGWTTPENADAYEELLQTRILPGIEDRPGYRGAYLLERVEDERSDEVEFITITLFDDLDAVRSFSHDGDRGAVVPPDARALLSRFDERSAHYRIARGPGEEG